MDTLRRVADRVVERPWVVVLLVAGVVLARWAVDTRTQDHHVRVAFDDAVSIGTGLDVQMNGVDVGKVSGVEYRDGQAIVRLGIEDPDAWPLRRGTVASLRYGTTVGNGTRRVDLHAGPADAPPVPEDGPIAARHVAGPTEFDEVFQTLDAPTRRNLRGLARRGEDVLGGRAADLDDGVRRTARTLESAAGVLGDLAADSRALESFVRHSDRTVGQLASRRERISALMRVGAATFDTFARHSDGVREALDRAPGTLDAVTTTLGRLDRSVGELDRLTADLAPGARTLRPLAAQARPALVSLRRLLPQARATVRTARRAGPEISEFLGEAQPFLRKTAPVLRDLAPITSCLRPYAPELAGFFSNWASFTKNFDGTSHYARVRLVEGQTSVTDTPDLATDEFLSGVGMGQLYAGLRPPGLNAGEPWFLEECGVGKDAIDPTKDWDDRR